MANVANDDSSTPRRALGPIPDDWADSPQSPDSPAGHHYEPPSPLTDTGLMRRLAAFRDDEPAKLTTPVPPPRPVLPDPEGALPPAHGRRFSANDIPYGEWAAPRRSAASPLSPIPDFNPVLPPPNRPTAPPSVTVPLSVSPDRPSLRWCTGCPGRSDLLRQVPEVDRYRADASAGRRARAVAAPGSTGRSRPAEGRAGRGQAGR